MTDTPTARLASLGYIITKKGRLVRKDCTSKGFIFTTQENYDQIGQAINDEVQRRLKSDLGLTEHWLPDKRYKGTGCNVFASPHILDSTAPLLVLICGKGPIYAGLWGRSLCINDNLDTGSMLPDIRRAQSLGWSVLVMNPNKRLIDPSVLSVDNDDDRFYFDEEDGETEVFDPFYDDNEFLRAEFAWRKFVVPSKAQSILVMGHSFGGAVVTSLFDLEGVAHRILPRVGAIALADSSHDCLPHGVEGGRMFLEDQDVVCNWVRSPTNPLDAREVSYDGVKCVSAGHKKHEYTLAAARESMWRFLIERASLSVDPKSIKVIPEIKSKEENVKIQAKIENKIESKIVNKSQAKNQSKSQIKPKVKQQQQQIKSKSQPKPSPPSSQVKPQQQSPKVKSQVKPQSKTNNKKLKKK